MKSTQTTALLLALIALSACSERPKSPAESPIRASVPESAPADPAVNSAAAAPVDHLVKNVVADGVSFQPEAAKVEGNMLVSTGTPGFVMFGPYVAFVPGKYRVTVKGSIPSLKSGGEVRFDAVSAAATAVHGEQTVNSAVPQIGNIAEFDITVPEGVTDLEVRAAVTEGADVRIESYELAKAD